MYLGGEERSVGAPAVALEIRNARRICYVAHLPAIDWLFGTYYLPRDKHVWPRRYGTIGVPMPKGIVRQFFYPFRAQAKMMRPGTSEKKVAA